MEKLKYYMGRGPMGDKIYIVASSPKGGLRKLSNVYGRSKGQSIEDWKVDNGVPEGYKLKPISKALYMKKRHEAYLGKEYGSNVGTRYAIIGDDTPTYKELSERA